MPTPVPVAAPPAPAPAAADPVLTAPAADHHHHHLDRPHQHDHLQQQPHGLAPHPQHDVWSGGLSEAGSDDESKGEGDADADADADGGGDVEGAGESGAPKSAGAGESAHAHAPAVDDVGPAGLGLTVDVDMDMNEGVVVDGDQNGEGGRGVAFEGAAGTVVEDGADDALVDDTNSQPALDLTDHAAMSEDEDEAQWHEDEDEDGEPPEDYREGGYHPVRLGDVIEGKFKITEKLGWGMYSTVWMGEDITNVARGASAAPNKNRRVALKIQKSSEDYYHAAINEIKLLTAVRTEEDRVGRPSYLVRLHDAFDVLGPNGTHPCMVFEPLGESLFGVMRNHQQLPFEAVQRITSHLLKGLDFLHSCNILHTDLKPENVLVVRRSHSNSELGGFGLNVGGGPAGEGMELISLAEDDHILGVKIVDLGNAFYIDQQEVYDIQTREYRCIESMLGIWPFQPAADIWSLGCLVFELVTGDTLFDPQLPEGVDESALEEGDFIKDESHLQQCLELIGPIPKHLIAMGERSPDWFDEAGVMMSMPDPAPADGVLEGVLEHNFEVEAPKAKLLADFVRYTLNYDPGLRPDAETCVEHPFVIE